MADENRMNPEYILELTCTVMRWEAGLEGTSFHYYIHKDQTLEPNYRVYDFASFPSRIYTCQKKLNVQ